MSTPLTQKWITREPKVELTNLHSEEKGHRLKENFGSIYEFQGNESNRETVPRTREIREVL